MIPAILNYVARKNHISKDKLSFVVVNGGFYRSEKSYRNSCLIFNDDQPYVVARWYNQQSDLLKSEAESLKYLEQRAFPSPKFIELAEINGVLILFEEFIAGRTLEQMLSLGQITKEEAFQTAVNLFDCLYQKTCEASTKQAFDAELDGLFALGEMHNVFEHRDFSVEEQKAIIVEAYNAVGFKTSFCHNDFITKNILSSASESYLFDVEFSARSHFFSSEWLRLLMYSPSLSSQGSFRSGMVDDRLLSMAMPQVVKQLLVDNETTRALKLLAYLSDFRISLQSADAASKNRVVGFLDAQICDCFLNSSIIGQTEQQSETSQESENLSAKQTHLEKRIKELEIHSTRLLRQIAARDCAMQTHLEIIKEKEDELAKRADIIQSIANSPAFRIGKGVTSAIKLVPGLSSWYERRRAS